MMNSIAARFGSFTASVALPLQGNINGQNLVAGAPTGKPATAPAAPNFGSQKAAEIANPTPKQGSGLSADQTKVLREADGQRINKAFGTKVITLPGDRQVNVHAQNNGTVLIDFPNETDPQKRVSLPVPGVNLKTSTPQQIKQAVQKLCNNTRLVPYVYNRGNRPISNRGDPTPVVKQSPEEKYVAQREAYAASIRDFPPGVKELAGVAGGFWFETLGKLGIGAKELIDTIQAMAKQITASPAAWKTFIDSNFAGNALDAQLYRKLLEGGLPKGGAGDGKTTVALLLALDRKVGILSNKLENALVTNPVGVGQKLLAGLKQMVKQELKDVSLNENSDPFVAFGTLLAKVVFGVLPLVKSGIAGAKAMKLAVAASAPKLLKTMGNAGFEGAVASVKLADAKLLALANKAKLPGGLSAAEKVQQAALTGQLKNAAKAASGNDAKGLQDASAALKKTLQKEAPGAAGDSNPAQRGSKAPPSARDHSEDAFYKIPHKGGRKFITTSGFVNEGRPPTTFANGNILGLDIGDRLFNSPAEADAALARFIAKKPKGEYSIRIFEVEHGNPMTKKHLVSIEPSEMKNLITLEAENRQIKRVSDWGMANQVRVKETRFDHNHPNERGNPTKAAIPSGVDDAKNNGDIQSFLETSISRRSDKSAIWAQDSKTVVKLEFTVKASPLDKKLRTLSAMEDRALFSKLFNDCFDVKMQKFDHRGNKIGLSKPFDVMGALSKESRNGVLEYAASALFATFGLYKALEWLEGKDKDSKAPAARD